MLEYTGDKEDIAPVPKAPWCRREDRDIVSAGSTGSYGELWKLVARRSEWFRWPRKASTVKWSLN